MSFPLLTARRIAVTLLVPLALVFLGDNLPLPGVPAELFDTARTHMARGSLGVFALGITPVVSASWIVEIVAFLVPRWAPLRRTLAGRTKLDRWAVATGIALASAQAWGIATSLKDAQASSDDLRSRLPSWSKPLVGGVCIQFLAASFITRAGQVVERARRDPRREHAPALRRRGERA